MIRPSETWDLRDYTVDRKVLPREALHFSRLGRRHAKPFFNLRGIWTARFPSSSELPQLLEALRDSRFLVLSALPLYAWDVIGKERPYQSFFYSSCCFWKPLAPIALLYIVPWETSVALLYENTVMLLSLSRVPVEWDNTSRRILEEFSGVSCYYSEY